MASRVGLWFIAMGLSSAVCLSADSRLEWPEITREQRPWAYNWWLGSAVDRDNLSRELRRYSEAGLGGIHVIPIYGAKGAEARYLPYLSEAWVEMLRFAAEEGGRLGLGVDMTTGTGWCFGGPDITPELGNMGAGVIRTNIPSGGVYSGRAGLVAAAVAVATNGRTADLMRSTNSAGAIEFRAEGGPWDVYALLVKPTGRKVKRAAPGGDGLMINPFSPASMRAYLKGFDRRMPADPAPRIRAMYHDSYEYYHGAKEFDAGWSPEFLGAFASRRGYRFQDHLRELGGGGDAEAANRILADYRETLSDLMIEDVFPQWTRWCQRRGILTRNQAHGSPANLLDLYALADIPETEMFGRGDRDPLASGFDARFGEGDREPLVSKFASSAAHVAGHRLVAAETGTWLAEHFCETLEEIKCLVDLLFVSGVNHVVYHGCCFSPDDAAWPGWLFYAATQMNPRNTIWRDAPALNAYIARCESILQSGEPDNDILLYWPIHDLWHQAAEMPGVLDPIECGVHTRDWLTDQAIGVTARRMWERGWSFDYVSDRQLAAAQARDGGIAVSGGAYGAVVVPPTTHMPIGTLRRLIELARGGATIIFEERLPMDVPGFADLERRRGELGRLLGELSIPSGGGTSVRSASVGKGRVLVGELEGALGAAGVGRETLADSPGVRFIRRRHAGGRYYFIANQGTVTLDKWFAPARLSAVAGLLDPMTGRVDGAAMCHRERGKAFRVRLEPGHSIVVRTFEGADATVSAPVREWFVPGPEGDALPGPWRVEFISGGPALPAAYEAGELRSWTENGDPETPRFAGTAIYRTRFDAPGDGPWVLDLGSVRHSARIRVNGREAGVLFMAPYRVTLDALRHRDNLLEVEVTNLAANRIRDMDRRKIPWRVFHDANLVSIRYKPFDASGWPVRESGLLGPVRLSAAVPAPSPSNPSDK